MFRLLFGRPDKEATKVNETAVSGSDMIVMTQKLLDLCAKYSQYNGRQVEEWTLGTLTSFADEMQQITTGGKQ